MVSKGPGLCAQDACFRILLQRGARCVAGGFHITVLILSFSSATVSGWLGDFVDEAKLYVLSTWSPWGVHSVLAGFCLAVNMLYHFLDKVLCAHCPGLMPLFHAQDSASACEFPEAWPRPVHLWVP